MDRRAQAEEALRHAVTCFGEERHWDVIQALEPAIRDLSGGSLRLAKLTLARAYAKNQNWRKRAEELLNAILSQDADDIEALETLGLIHRDAGMNAQGEALLKRAEELKKKKDWRN